MSPPGDASLAHHPAAPAGSTPAGPVAHRPPLRSGAWSSRALAATVTLLLWACAAPPAPPPLPAPPPRTTVTLLPDADGRVGAVLVEGRQGEPQRIDQAYASAVVADGASAAQPAQARSDEAQLRQAHRALFDAMPLPPYSTLLYFVAGSTELTAESRALLPALVARIRERGPTEIALIGHTDTTGSDAFNLRLSQERAREVDRLLRSALPELGPTTLRFFGARELLVPTGPNVDEPRNRRVEVHVL